MENLKINVADIHQLYAAVNDPENIGCQIVMAPNNYVLNNTLGQPNGGRLELQYNMELTGKHGNADLVIIDTSLLPAESFLLPFITGEPLKTGAIRMGKGSNKIEWLTVKGNSNAMSALDTDLCSRQAYIKIARLVISNSLTAINIRNNGSESIERILVADIEHNELVNNLVENGQGIVIQNSAGAHSAIILASLQDNNIHGNKVGLRSHNQHTDNGRIVIKSTADKFYENGIGCIMNAGLDTNPYNIATTANNNSISFETHNTSIQNNNGELPPDLTPACGIYAVGGTSLLAEGRTSHNKLDMNLNGCFINGNKSDDVVALGAFSSQAAFAGTHNAVKLKLHSECEKTIIHIARAFPVQQIETNIVKIIRSSNEAEIWQNTKKTTLISSH